MTDKTRVGQADTDRNRINRGRADKLRHRPTEDTDRGGETAKMGGGGAYNLQRAKTAVLTNLGLRSPSS